MSGFLLGEFALPITGDVRRKPEEGDEMTIAPAQIKAARRLLGWTQVELSRRSSVPNSVIALFETRKRSLALGTIGGLKMTLEAAGIEFLGDDSGVRLRSGDYENAPTAD
jgi:transcriptional regulator with XRE-family HTH domain